MLTRSALFVCFVAVVACQGPVPDSQTTEPTPLAPLDFVVEADGPVIEPEDFGAAYLLPGAAVAQDGITWTRITGSLAGADDPDALGPSACGIDARSMVEPHLLSAEDRNRL
ncbi:MAG: hypothetical protein ABR593_02750, partial [Candidatus Limnocylindria bacterium]